MDKEEIKRLTEKSMEYASIPPSGRGDDSIEIKLEDILPKLKKFSVRKPIAYIVGSVAVHGKSNNDIDILVRGEDWSKKQKEAFEFRIYRMFSEILDIEYDETPKYVQILYSNSGPYTDAIPIYEDTIYPIKDGEKVKMSKNIEKSKNKFHVDINGSIQKAKFDKRGNRRIIAGYASLVVVDSENQLIPKEALEKGIKTLLDNETYANLMLVHQNIQIGKILKKFGNLRTHVDDKGLFIVAEIRQDINTANKVWDQILNGDMRGFSIAGEIEEAHKQCDDTKCVEIIDRLNIFEISICDCPINEKSGFVIVKKSKLCDMYKNKTDDIMSEDEDIEKSKEDLEVDDECEDCELDKSEESEEEVEKTEHEDEKEMQEDDEDDEEMEGEEVMSRIDKLESQIQSMQEVLTQLSEHFQEDDEEEEDEMEEEEDDYPEPEKYPYPEKSNGLVGAIKDKLENLSEENCSQEDIDEIKSMLSNLNEGNKNKSESEEDKQEEQVKSDDSVEESEDKIEKSKGEVEETDDELRLAIKARDDTISGLEDTIKELKSRIEDLEETEETPKTKKNKNSSSVIRDDRVKFKHGRIYKE